MRSNESAAEVLQEKGIKPSYARMQIYDYIREKRNHPTVEDIYAELVRMIPTLSRTTIYNTLTLFLQNNLLQPVTIEGKRNALRCGYQYARALQVYQLRQGLRFHYGCGKFKGQRPGWFRDQAEKRLLCGQMQRLRRGGGAAESLRSRKSYKITMPP